MDTMDPVELSNQLLENQRFKETIKAHFDKPEVFEESYDDLYQKIKLKGPSSLQEIKALAWDIMRHIYQDVAAQRNDPDMFSVWFAIADTLVDELYLREIHGVGNTDQDQSDGSDEGPN